MIHQKNALASTTKVHSRWVLTSLASLRKTCRFRDMFCWPCNNFVERQNNNYRMMGGCIGAPRVMYTNGANAEVRCNGQKGTRMTSLA